MSFPYVSDAVNAMFGTTWTLPIPVFGLLVATAICASAWLLRREVQWHEERGKLPHHAHTLVADLVAIATLAGLLGARVFHILEYPGQFIANPATMIFTRSGFSIFGGLCFGIISAIVVLKRRAVPALAMLDATAPGLALGYAIGRLGCQLSGDGDWGTTADMSLKPHWLPDWIWSQTYQGNILGVQIPSPGVYPTPIYESLMALMVLAILWRLRTQESRPGFLFCVYLLLTGFARLLIEKIRINAQYHVLGVAFTQAEAISCLLVIAGSIGILVTLPTRRWLTRIVFSLSVLTALSACVSH